MIDKEEFNKQLEIVKEILNDSSYNIQKEVIKELFEKTKNNLKKDVLLRLVVIDSGYSTNMNKRLFGFEDLTNLILELDEELEKIKVVEDVLDFVKKNLNTNILLRDVGIDKKGGNKGHAFSLISKYIFFRTKYHFPIYDRLVFEGLKIKGQRNPSEEYFEKLVKLKREWDVSFDDLDKFFWVCGKIKEKNLSLLFPNSNSYKNFRNGNFNDKTAKNILKIEEMINRD